jgi:hypothetical protein
MRFMTSRRLCASLLTPGLLAACALARATTLDFGNGPTPPSICNEVGNDGTAPVTGCTAGRFVSQSYGDVAGVVDLSYVSPRATSPTSLKWWDTLYNNLYGVLYAGVGSDGNSLARIEIKALAPDAVVTLAGFDLGAYAQTTLGTSVNVYAIGGGTPLYSYSGPVGNGSVSATGFSVDVGAVGGLWIEWGDSAFNVAIDNIQYSVSSVPEPAPAWLLLAGGMLGFRALRRRRERA